MVTWTEACPHDTVNQSGWGNLIPDLWLEAFPALSHQDVVTTDIQQRALKYMA